MKVLVVISYYNSELFLKEAINSILNQTYGNFDFWLINDGSTDKSESIAKSIRDPRIRYFTNEKNIGLSKTLNKVITESNHDYLVRMDSDDISFPNRIKTQIEAFKNDSNIGLCCSARNILDSNQIYNKYFPKNLKSSFLKKNWIAHPTVVLNLKILKINKLNYDVSIKYAQDYDLWLRVIQSGIKIHHIEEPLINYRHHNNQIASRKKFQQDIYTYFIRIKFFFKFL